MTKFYETVIEVLKQDTRFFTEDGILLKNAVYEAAMQMDENLISILLGLIIEINIIQNGRFLLY